MLVVDKLGFSFNHRPLFQKLSFTLKPGEIFHLVGANGAGKSTCFSIISGLRPPSHGGIQYLDKEEDVDDRRDFIEYLSAEANGVYLRMDATENLMFWTKLRGLSIGQESIFAELDRWGLGHPFVRQNFAVEKISTGMRRRLALARVKLSGTPCWLLDEPIYGLDHKGIALFRQMLADHKANGGMALIISHDTSPLAGLTDQTISLDQLA